MIHPLIMQFLGVHKTKIGFPLFREEKVLELKIQPPNSSYGADVDVDRSWEKISELMCELQIMANIIKNEQFVDFLKDLFLEKVGIFVTSQKFQKLIIKHNVRKYHLVMRDGLTAHENRIIFMFICETINPISDQFSVRLFGI